MGAAAPLPLPPCSTSTTEGDSGGLDRRKGDEPGAVAQVLGQILVLHLLFCLMPNTWAVPVLPAIR